MPARNGSELARRQLQYDLAVRITELPHKQQLALVRQRGDRHAAVVLDHFARAGLAVRQLRLIHAQIDDPPFVFVFLLQRFFKQFHNASIKIAAPI